MSSVSASRRASTRHGTLVSCAVSPSTGPATPKGEAASSATRAASPCRRTPRSSWPDRYTRAWRRRGWQSDADAGHGDRTARAASWFRRCRPREASRLITSQLTSLTNILSHRSYQSFQLFGSAVSLTEGLFSASAAMVTAEAELLFFFCPGGPFALPLARPARVINHWRGTARRFYRKTQLARPQGRARARRAPGRRDGRTRSPRRTTMLVVGSDRFVARRRRADAWRARLRLLRAWPKGSDRAAR